MAGLFITFEGIEGSGKTTVINRVAETLRTEGREVVITREPGGTLIGDKVRTLLLDPSHDSMTPLAELFLYCASRSQHVAEVIEPALAAGQIVLCDRYADATVAYQGAARKIPAATIGRLRKIATAGVEPKITILLDVPVEIGLKRMSGRGAETDRLERENIFFHKRVRNGYLKLARKEPERIKIVDASRMPEAVFEETMQLINVVLATGN